VLPEAHVRRVSRARRHFFPIDLSENFISPGQADRPANRIVQETRSATLLCKGVFDDQANCSLLKYERAWHRQKRSRRDVDRPIGGSLLRATCAAIRADIACDAFESRSPAHNGRLKYKKDVLSFSYRISFSFQRPRRVRHAPFLTVWRVSRRTRFLFVARARQTALSFSAECTSGQDGAQGADVHYYAPDCHLAP